MTAGLSALVASWWLNSLLGTSFTPPAALWGQIHVGDPGAAGTANPSAVTARSQITATASSSGSALVLSNIPAWTETATEKATHLSVWSAASGGNFLFSAVGNVSQALNPGDILQLTSLTVAAGPQAG